VVAIVRTIEGVSSFSCRPRQHPTAKGDPKTGRRPTNTAEHHLRRGQHRVCVYYFFVFDAHWGRASVRLASYLPFEVTLQLNGHDYLERQRHRQRRQITMAANAVAHVADWPALRNRSDLDAALTAFGAVLLHEISDPDVIAVFRLGDALQLVRPSFIKCCVFFVYLELNRDIFLEIASHVYCNGFIWHHRECQSVDHYGCCDSTCELSTFWLGNECLWEILDGEDQVIVSGIADLE